MSTIRGRILCTNRPVQVAPGITAHGVKPRIIVRVKGSRNMRDDWQKAVRHLGLDAIPVQTVGDDDFVVSWDVTGSFESLEALTQRRCIVDWHFALDVAVPRTGSGAGDDKPVRRTHPLTQRLIASVQHATRNDDAIAAAKLSTLESQAALGIAG